MYTSILGSLQSLEKFDFSSDLLKLRFGKIDASAGRLSSSIGSPNQHRLANHSECPNLGFIKDLSFISEYMHKQESSLMFEDQLCCHLAGR
jgi:hypothetical protein